MLKVLEHSTAILAQGLAARRTYMGDNHRGKAIGLGQTDGLGGRIYDPRYLVFEYISGFMLRPRQVELISAFVESGRGTVRDSSGLRISDFLELSGISYDLGSLDLLGLVANVQSAEGEPPFI